MRNYDRVHPRKPAGIEERKAYIVGGGIAGLSAAAFLVRDAQMPGGNITVYDQLPVFGGSMDCAGASETGYVSRGERELEPYMECLWDLFGSIPSLYEEGRTVLGEARECNKNWEIDSKHRPWKQGFRPHDESTMGVTPNGDQLKILTHRELVPQLGDVHIHGAQRGLGVHVPELLHKLGAGEDTLGVREELEQGVELPGRQRDLLTVTYRRLIVGVHHKAAHSQLVFAGDIGPPQQRPDPQHQLVQVNGFDHVIVDPCLIALLLGAVVVSGGHKENGNFAVNAPHSGGKLKAVDAGHHNIRYDQRIGTVVHLVVCVLGVPAARGLIVVAVQVIAHDAVELLIVFHNKYSQHIRLLLRFFS